MATITKRRGKRGVIKYRVRIRSGGVSQSATFDTLRAAEQWAQIVESMTTARKLGLVRQEEAAAHTLAAAIARYRREVLARRASVAASAARASGAARGRAG